MLLKMAPTIRQWLEGLHKTAYHDARVGNPVPDMKLVSGKRPARKYIETQEHKAEIVLKMELGDDAYLPRKLRSPTQAEKKLGKARYMEVLDRFVDAGAPQPILVPEEDRRPRLESAVDMFDDLDEPNDVL